MKINEIKVYKKEDISFEVKNINQKKESTEEIHSRVKNGKKQYQHNLSYDNKVNRLFNQDIDGHLNFSKQNKKLFIPKYCESNKIFSEENEQKKSKLSSFNYKTQYRTVYYNDTDIFTTRGAFNTINEKDYSTKRKDCRASIERSSFASKSTNKTYARK
jgi:hypothetical protein